MWTSLLKSHDNCIVYFSLSICDINISFHSPIPILHLHPHLQSLCVHLMELVMEMGLFLHVITIVKYLLVFNNTNTQPVNILVVKVHTLNLTNHCKVCCVYMYCIIILTYYTHLLLYHTHSTLILYYRTSSPVSQSPSMVSNSLSCITLTLH